VLHFEHFNWHNAHTKFSANGLQGISAAVENSTAVVHYVATKH